MHFMRATISNHISVETGLMEVSEALFPKCNTPHYCVIMPAAHIVTTAHLPDKKSPQRHLHKLKMCCNVIDTSVKRDFAQSINHHHHQLAAQIPYKTSCTYLLASSPLINFHGWFS